MQKLIKKGIKPVEVIIFGSPDSEILNMPSLECGYITKQLKKELDKLKMTSKSYNSLAIAAN
jgi:hypothetical protein